MATTTRKPKFGLAWLFSKTGRQDYSNTSKKQKSEKEKEVDKRIKSTNLEIEGSIGDSRISVYSTDIKPWKENHESCHFKSDIPPGVSRIEAQEGDTITLKCMLHDLHHEVDFDKFQVSWSFSEHKQNEIKVKDSEKDSNSNVTATKIGLKGKLLTMRMKVANS